MSEYRITVRLLLLSHHHSLGSYSPIVCHCITYMLSDLSNVYVNLFDLNLIQINSIQNSALLNIVDC